MLENYRVYKVDGKVIGNYFTLEEAQVAVRKNKGARIATKKDDSKGWNYAAVQGRLF